MKSQYLLIPIGIMIPLIILIIYMFQSTVNLPINENHIQNIQNNTYYVSPTIMNITEGEKIKFDDSIFTYNGITPVTTGQCTASKVKSTYKDYITNEIAHFTIAFGGKIHTIDTCWLPPWTGQLPIAHLPSQLPSHGINTVGVGGYCVPVILWADKERDAGISVGIGKTTWILENGTVLHPMFCNDNGSIHILVKKDT